MIDALDSPLGGADYGAMGAVFGKDREQRAAQMAEAARKGRLAAGQDGLEAKVREVAEDFVSVFMSQVMKSMRSTVMENPEMHGDNGEKFFQEMLDSEQSKTLAQGSGYGLTDLVYQSLMSQYRVATLEATNAPPQPVSEAETAVEDNDMVVEAIG